MASKHQTGNRSKNQTFLIGPSLYLRPVELEDAASAAIWQATPFPLPQEVMEERLKTRQERDTAEAESDRLLIACRRDSDQPVGSANVEIRDGRWSELRFAIDPLMADSTQTAIMIELIEILVDWLINERGVMFVSVVDMADRAGIEARIEQLGGRVSARHRERLLNRGERCDLVLYQVFSEHWRRFLGEPELPPFGEVQRVTPRPAGSRQSFAPDDRITDALAVGESVYLRPFRTTDGQQISKWSLQETEQFYLEGRALYSAHTYSHYHVTIAEQNPPQNLRFAIALRETDELIGCNGLENIDWAHRTAETETEIFRPQHRNAGFGTEAKHLLLDYTFNRIGMHMIYSFVATSNPRSAAALKKQGYREAGLMSWDSFTPGGLGGYWSFDLLASEWNAAREASQDDDQ